MKSLKAGRIISNVVIYIILIIMSILWVLPIIWLVLQSFSGDGLASRSRLIPKTFTFSNYINLLTGSSSSDAVVHALDGKFPIWILNTLIVSVLVCLISTVFVLGTAYALSRFRFKGRTMLMKLNLVIGMFPGFLSMIIMYWVMKEIFHLQGSYWSLVIIYSAGAGGGYYISKGFFDTISKSIDEAAMIDGATKSQIFWQIILPLAKPIVVYTILMAFTAPWGDFMLASYLAQGRQELFNVAVGLQGMLTKDNANKNFPIFCAGGVVTSIPIVTLFFCLQKYYVEGVTGGAVKG